MESSDCGIACIRMIAYYLGIKIGYPQLKKLCQGSRVGVSMRDIVDTCKKIGLEAYPVTITEGKLETCPLPGIFYWNNNHFIVVYKIDWRRGKVYIADPASGKYTLKIDEFLSHWKQKSERGIVILVASATDNQEKKIFKSSKYDSFRLFKYLFREFYIIKYKFTFFLIFALLSLCTDFLTPYLLQHTIDEGIGSKDIGLVWMFILAQFAVFFGNFVSNQLSGYLISKLSLHIDMKMIGEYLLKLISLPLSFFDRKSGADLIQKIGDYARIRSLLISLPQTFGIAFLNIVIFSGMMLYYSTNIVFVFIIFTLCGIIWNTIFLGKRRSIDATQFSENATNNNLIYELINGMSEIKCNSAENIKYESWKNSQDKINKTALKSTRLEITITGGSELLSRIRDILITGICAGMVINDTLSFGGMMTISYITGRLSAPFSTLMANISYIQDASLSYDRLEEIITSDSEHGNESNFSNMEISLENVWFKYPGTNSQFVLKDLSMTIAPGETVAIVGESGCGKSTLIKLFLGFYTPTKGKLTLGSIDSKDANKREWIKQCGVVMQSGFLFSDTILANITLTSDINEIDNDKFKTALKIAGIEKFINSLPMKEHTKVGTTGIEMSGGQKQRLLIARALYKNPRLLIMDEATSSLDANTEANIVKRLKVYDRGRTVIISAHRLSTVRHADKIFYIKDGRITEYGTHSKLMELKGDYHSLVNTQLAPE